MGDGSIETRAFDRLISEAAKRLGPTSPPRLQAAALTMAMRDDVADLVAAQCVLTLAEQGKSLTEIDRECGSLGPRS